MEVKIYAAGGGGIIFVNTLSNSVERILRILLDHSVYIDTSKSNLRGSVPMESVPDQ